MSRENSSRVPSPRASGERVAEGRVRGRVIAAAAVLIVAVLWLRLGPIDPSLLDRTRFQSVTVLDRNGEVLYEPLAASGTRGTWLQAGTVPPLVAEATLTAEDRRFRFHPGVDPLAVGRAMLHNARARRVVEGGSTITQQVAKLLLGAQRRSLSQKAREAVLAMRLEHRLDKDEILALYLNLAPYGNGIIGIARAGRTYFGVDPAQLTPAQSAFLASLPQRPSAFNPLRDPVRAQSRQRAILMRMRLPDDVRTRALREDLRFNAGGQPVVAMHFVERVLDLCNGRGEDGARGERGEEETGRKGRSASARPVFPSPGHLLASPFFAPCAAILRTTLDARLQRQVMGIIRAHRETLLRHGARSVAVAVLDNETGEWLAWEGSGDYFGAHFGGAIDGVSTPRQPGSTLKPFTYALAFESGRTPATVIADVRTHFPTAEPGVVYTPRNYDGRYRGPLLARAALAGSENVPAVALLSRLGPESLLRLLRTAGFASLDRTADYYGLGLTLGDAEVTLEQLVTAYAAFARGGMKARPTFFAEPSSSPAIQQSSTQEAGSLDRWSADRLVSPRTAFWITDILSDAEAREYAFGSGGSLEFPFPVAVKTGTSQAYRDNWTVGYTRDVTVGVWVGNFDLRPLHGSSGVTGAAPVFNAVMLAAVKRARGMLPVGETAPVVAVPPGVEEEAICTLSGARPSPWCPGTRREWLAKGETVPFCDWHHDGWIDWPAEYRSWARASAPAAPTVPKIAAAKRDAPLRIANPADGATFLIDPTLRMEFQTLRLRADATSRVSWHVDERRIARASPDAAVEWSLVPGPHTITAVDARGRRDSVRIFVK